MILLCGYKDDHSDHDAKLQAVLKWLERQVSDLIQINARSDAPSCLSLGTSLLQGIIIMDPSTSLADLPWYGSIS